MELSQKIKFPFLDFQKYLFNIILNQNEFKNLSNKEIVLSRPLTNKGEFSQFHVIVQIKEKNKKH